MSAGKGSIAQVCRDLDMNRQQFNKYLSGTNLPGPATLEKIAQYFGVDQLSMFVGAGTSYSIASEEPRNSIRPFSHIEPKLLAAISESLADSETVKLQEGCHLIYFPWQREPRDIIRAMMIVFKVGKFTCFRRYTKISMGEESNFRVGLGRHEGIVFEQNGRTFLLGKNMKGFGEMSLMSFGSSTVANLGMMNGLAAVFDERAEPMASRVTISHFGTKNDFRRAFKLCGLIPANSSQIPEHIRKSVLGTVEFPIGMLSPFSMFDELRRHRKII